MSREGSRPNYIYKLVPSSSPMPLDHADLPEHLLLSEIDGSSGFIHLSTSLQVPGTLKYLFADDLLIYVLRINYDKLDDKICWEDPKAQVCGPQGGEGMFLHLYNGLKLSKEEIKQVHVLENGEGGWDATLEKAKEWLLW